MTAHDHPIRRIRDAAGARTALLELAERVARDPHSEFPAVLKSLGDRRLPDLVLMCGQHTTMDYHLDLIAAILARHPGTRLRAVVDEDPALVRRRRFPEPDIPVLTVRDFLSRAAEFRDCLVIDRYCTWMPAPKYATYLDRAGLPWVRFEQFVNAPGMPEGLPSPGSHYREHARFMLPRLDRLLEVESLWADERSRMVYYTALAGFIAMDFGWFAPGCDPYEQRYFPPDLDFAPREDEVFLDCGAFEGEDAILFARLTRNRFRRVLAFEPDLENYRVMSENLRRHMAEHGTCAVDTFPMGVGDTNGYLRFSGEGMMVSLAGEGGGDKGLFLTRLDDMVDRATTIKLEVEGAEMAALAGAARLIREHRPRLAVAVYHKPDDFLTIPQHIAALGQNYRIGLRHHAYEAGLMCAYAY
jgi:FkbM family methyltransferase